MERIRYRKTDDGTLISIQTFRHPTNGAEYSVAIAQDEKGLVVTIYEVHTTMVAALEETTRNKLQAQKRAKKMLEGLGIDMPMERRARRK